MVPVMAQAQPDLFNADPQADLFGGEPPPPAYRPDPDRVRRRLERILVQARAAATMPWDRSQLGLYRIVVPQLSLHLPDEEGERWRLDFEREVERLDTA